MASQAAKGLLAAFSGGLQSIEQTHQATNEQQAKLTLEDYRFQKQVELAKMKKQFDLEVEDYKEKYRVSGRAEEAGYESGLLEQKNTFSTSDREDDQAHELDKIDKEATNRRKDHLLGLNEKTTTTEKTPPAAQSHQISRAESNFASSLEAYVDVPLLGETKDLKGLATNIRQLLGTPSRTKKLPPAKIKALKDALFAIEKYNDKILEPGVREEKHYKEIIQGIVGSLGSGSVEEETTTDSPRQFTILGKE